MKIGFIGAGNMGSALAKAIAKCPYAELFICDIDKEKESLLAEATSAVTSSLKEISEFCNLIFLAVKPNFIRAVIADIKNYLRNRSEVTLVSMAAGVALSSLEESVGFTIPIIRIMPNTPVAVGKGIVLTAKNSYVNEKIFADFKDIMRYTGDVDLIDEYLIDAGTALSGCSPAFVYMFIDALARGAEKAGLERDTAKRYAAKALIGASELLLASGTEPSELKMAVCSPGGSTIEGVRVLENGGFNKLVEDAINASFEKTKALGKQ